MKDYIYKYILCGQISETDRISDYRLISANHVKIRTTKVDGTNDLYIPSEVVRIKIPSNIKRYTINQYQIINDEMYKDSLIKDVEYDILVCFNGKYKVMKNFTLKDYNNQNIQKVLKDKGYTDSKNGYLNKSQYQEYINEMRQKIILGIEQDKIEIIKSIEVVKKDNSDKNIKEIIPILIDELLKSYNVYWICDRSLRIVSYLMNAYINCQNYSKEEYDKIANEIFDIFTDCIHKKNMFDVGL